MIIPVAIETVEMDGGAFNVREGNNSVNAAILFGLRDRLEPIVRLSADYCDVNLVTAWSPLEPANKFWAGLEISYGNGFLERLEHRKQYKGNVSKVFTLGRHELTVYGIGYYGFAFQPGLIPIDTHLPGDTVDARQSEETSNRALILNDVWHLTNRRQFQFSGSYRYYTLDVRPNFGDNVDLNFYSLYVEVDGRLLRCFHYNLGYRHDQVSMDNQDLYRPDLSFSGRASINSPKATISLLPPDSAAYLPMVSLSYGQAFFINDPRIGTTAIMGHDC